MSQNRHKGTNKYRYQGADVPTRFSIYVHINLKLHRPLLARIKPYKHVTLCSSNRVDCTQERSVAYNLSLPSLQSLCLNFIYTGCAQKAPFNLFSVLLLDYQLIILQIHKPNPPPQKQANKQAENRRMQNRASL